MVLVLTFVDYSNYTNSVYTSDSHFVNHKNNFQKEILIKINYDELKIHNDDV